jgi:hypothetical protein
MHRDAKTIGDKIAYYVVKIARFVSLTLSMVPSTTICPNRAVVDFATGYKHKPIPPGSDMAIEQLRKEGYILDEHGWLNVSICCHFYHVDLRLNECSVSCS